MRTEILGNNTQSYRTFLKEEFCARKKRNSRYSLRAFARDLDVSLTALSDSLSGKRDLSKDNIEKLVNCLGASPSQKQSFLAEISRAKKSSESESNKVTIEDDVFAMISEWHYLAILNLAQLPKLKANPSQIAKRLGLLAWDVEVAIDRLLRLELLEIRNGCLHRTTAPFRTKQDVPSAAVRKYHRQILQLAEESLEGVPVHLRDITASTFPVDLEELKCAKEKIAEFKAQLSKRLAGKNPTEVYSLSIQLIPLSMKG